MNLRLTTPLRRLLPSLILLAASALQAAEPPTAPILRIQAEMHTATIPRMAVHEAGRLVLTCSDDKTAKLWRLQEDAAGTGAELLQTLRLPIGQGAEGRLQACALSPDGSLAAVGGITGYLWDGSTSVYLFDTSNGRMIRRMSESMDRIGTLAFSPDGRWIAVGSSAAGLRIFDVSTGRVAAADQDCGLVSSVDWDQTGRLLTASSDGHLRMYHARDLPDRAGSALPVRLQPSTKAKVSSDGMAPDARFSADGTVVAVGFMGNSNVLIAPSTSLSDLHGLKTKATQGPPQTMFNRVEWSSDNRVLAAGGSAARNVGAGGTLWSIRQWEALNRWKSSDCDAAANPICDIRRLPGGRFLFASAEPSWGIVSAGGARVTTLGAPPISDFRSRTVYERFLVSADASVVAFEYAEGRRAVFSVNDRKLTAARAASVDAPAFKGLHAPRTSSPDFEITEWKQSTAPKLGGRRLELKRGEQARCLAIARDNSFFLLGCDFTLRCYDRKGAELWSLVTPDTVWALNLSADGGHAVAAHGDGTIRWHDVRQHGRELLSLFPHIDQRRWILWAARSTTRECGRAGITVGSVDGSVVAMDVPDDGPAKPAGVRKGDTIVELDGVKITNAGSFPLMVRSHLPGDRVSVVVLRDGIQMSIPIELAAQPDPEVITGDTYFDCSPNGEDLIGWHMNRGKDQAADFFPVSRFRSVYYRPDVIQRALQTKDVAEALRQANAALGRPDDPPEQIADVIARLSPPVVELGTGGMLREVVLPPGAPDFELNYRIRQAGQQPATKVEIRANGRPLPVTATVPRQGEEISIDVPLPAGFEGTVSVIASHALASSEAAAVQIRQSSPPRTPRPPRLFVISVGAAELAMNQAPLLAANDTVPAGAKDRFQNLEFAAEDARKVAALLQAQQGKAFREVKSRVLLDKQALTTSLRSAIQDVAAEAELGDVVFFFFSGHGNHDPKTGKFHLVTHDTDPQREAETAFSGEELSRLLGEVRGYVVVALDACHSGAVLGMQLGEKYQAPPLDISGLANQLSSAEHGIVVLSSSSPDQLSFEDRELGGGLFTKALLEGLEGKAAGKGDVISCQSLMQWIDRRLPGLAGADLSQNPVTVMPKDVPDFALIKP